MDELSRLWKRSNVFCDFGMQSSERPKFGDEMRIRQKANIEDEIRIFRNPMLESETHSGNKNLSGLFLFLKQFNNMRSQFVDIKFGGIDDQVCDGANMLQVPTFRAQRRLDRRVSP